MKETVLELELELGQQLGIKIDIDFDIDIETQPPATDVRQLLSSSPIVDEDVYHQLSRPYQNEAIEDKTFPICVDDNFSYEDTDTESNAAAAVGTILLSTTSESFNNIYPDIQAVVGESTERIGENRKRPFVEFSQNTNTSAKPMLSYPSTSTSNGDTLAKDSRRKRSHSKHNRDSASSASRLRRRFICSHYGQSICRYVPTVSSRRTNYN